MKVRHVIPVLLMLCILLLAVPAYAGALDRFKDVSAGMLVSIGFNAVFGLITLFVGSKAKRFKQMAKEGIDCGVWLIESTSAKSDGGRQITQKELETGVKEFGEFGAELSTVIKAGKTAA